LPSVVVLQAISVVRGSARGDRIVVAILRK
jgi:hypothetical protein